jgi:hypothetical protein
MEVRDMRDLRAIEQGKFTEDGLKDVIEWIEMAECYKNTSAEKDFKSSPEYWKFLDVEGLTEQLIENEDGEVDWISLWEHDTWAFDDLFIEALRAWGLDGRELTYRNITNYDGSEKCQLAWHIVLK